MVKKTSGKTRAPDQQLSNLSVQQNLKRLLRQVAGPLPPCTLQWVDGRGVPRICISHNFPGNADAAGPGATLTNGYVATG